jgi:hypothetical protein
MSETVQLNRRLFKLFHKKDGFEVPMALRYDQKLILQGWRLQDYDIEDDDVIRIQTESLEFTRPEYEKFIFRASLNESITIDISDSYERQPSIRENIDVAERLPELIAQGNKAMLYKLIEENLPMNGNIITRINKDGWALIHHMSYYACAEYVAYIQQQ